PVRLGERLGRAGRPPRLRRARRGRRLRHHASFIGGAARHLDTPEASAKAAGTRRAGPRSEAATGVIRACRRLELRPGRPAVGGAPAAEVVAPVEPLEAEVHLQAAVVAVAGVRVPAALVVMDAQEGAREETREPWARAAVEKDAESCLREPFLPEEERRCAVTRTGSSEAPGDDPRVDPAQP